MTSRSLRSRARRAAVRWRRAGRYVERKLTWNRLYRATSYVRSTLWTVPLVAIFFVLLAAPVLRWIDTWLDWRFTALDVGGATTMFQTVITLALSFLVFTFGSLLVAIQIAGGQLTPRIIATTLLRDNVVRYSVGLFTFALVFAVTALNRLEGNVHQLVALVVALLGIACMAMFLFLIDYAARLLRPVSILAKVSEGGIAVIRAVYPHPAAGLRTHAAAGGDAIGAVRRVVEHKGRSEIVLAVDLPRLVALARRHDGVIEVVPQVGDFVAADEPLLRLYGGAAGIDDRELRATAAFGPERTLEQDPMFALRILVDIGLKALSPAINDPTTGVLALDQVHRLLRFVGRRSLHGEVIEDEAGRARVMFRTPNWDDFVHVGCREIRKYGADNIQIARRMRAMLENLLGALPPHRRPALKEELDLLDRTIEANFPLAEDAALARIADSQGLGGSSGARLARPT
jgi:uncharacterized membrane protein